MSRRRESRSVYSGGGAPDHIAKLAFSFRSLGHQQITHRCYPQAPPGYPPSPIANPRRITRFRPLLLDPSAVALPTL